MGRRSKSRSLISTQSLLIILCLLLIAVAVHMLFSEDDEKIVVGQAKEQTQAQNQEKDQVQNKAQTENKTKPTTNSEISKKDEVKVVQSGNSANEINEQEARKLAVKQDKELNERWVKEKDLEVLEFSRANEYYYYISSKENTVEIKKDGGKITRINSVPVQ